MKIEEIKAQAEEHLQALEINTNELYNVVEHIATGNGSITELDEVYKLLKQDVKALNKLAKAYRKIVPQQVEEGGSEDDQ